MDASLKKKMLSKKAASIWKTRNFELLYDIYDKNCVHHQQSNHQNLTLNGIEAWEEYIKNFILKYPDYDEKIVNQICENNKVVTMIECQGSDRLWTGIIVDLIKKNKIIETWAWFKRIS